MKYLVSITIGLLLALFSGAQSNFERTVKEYYRVDPFHGSFSAFVDALTTDSALLNKQILKQTDTTGFFARGEYNVFNPFNLDANKVDMIFYENDFIRNGKRLFNYYTYQLTAYFPDTELTRKAVKKNYNQLFRKLSKDLHDVNREPLKGVDGIEDGELASFSQYATSFAAAPALLSWQTLSKTRQLGLTIIVKFRQVDNRAYPISIR